MEPKLFFASAFIGVLIGLGNFMYSIGLSNLPIKTSSGVTKAKYLLGFFLTLGSAVFAGLTMPMIELSYRKATRMLNYSTFLQFQFIPAMFSTIFNIVGMLINKDFQALSKEASMDWEVACILFYSSPVMWQLSALGGVGVIFYASSGGVFFSVLLPLSELAAVIAYHENFTGEKGMAVALCLWGFGNYFYGEYSNTKAVIILLLIPNPSRKLQQCYELLHFQPRYSS